MIMILYVSKMFIDSSFNSLYDQMNIEGYNLITADHPNGNKKGGVCNYFKEL